MKRLLLLSQALTFALLVVISASAQIDAKASANASLAGVTITNMQRTVLHGDIVHYIFDVSVGSGQFDRIRLHRVVREKNPYQPIRTVTGVVLFPGSPNSFEMIFMEPLISAVPAWDQSITAFLAKNNIDVWGMDYRWALVPAGATDFKFMKTWGYQRDVDDAKIAVSLARLIRGGTGQGLGQLNVLGFSYGTYMSYAIANQETLLPKVLRNAKGLIQVDWGIVYSANSPMRQNMCDRIPGVQAMFDAGTYAEDNSAMALMGALAKSSPNDPSQFADGFTNYQFGLFVGASPMYSPTWHFVADVLDKDGMPTDLQYTDPVLWFDVLGAIPTYFPTKADLETFWVSCHDVVAPFDEHLKKVTLPILYIGAAGGTGKEGYYSVQKTGAEDVTKSTVQFNPDSEVMMDFGHADLFTATNAETLVWQPIFDWLVAHQ